MENCMDKYISGNGKHSDLVKSLYGINPDRKFLELEKYINQIADEKDVTLEFMSYKEYSKFIDEYVFTDKDYKAFNLEESINPFYDGYFGFINDKLYLFEAYDDSVRLVLQKEKVMEGNIPLDAIVPSPYLEADSLNDILADAPLCSISDEEHNLLQNASIEDWSAIMMIEEDIDNGTDWKPISSFATYGITLSNPKDYLQIKDEQTKLDEEYSIKEGELTLYDIISKYEKEQKETDSINIDDDLEISDDNDLSIE